MIDFQNSAVGTVAKFCEYVILKTSKIHTYKKGFLYFICDSQMPNISMFHQEHTHVTFIECHVKDVSGTSYLMWGHSRQLGT